VSFQVSAFGESGDGDSGDNWIVQCVDGAGGDGIWEREHKVHTKTTRMQLCDC
jgi:dolichyl-phosphate-mannose--protein O-mannosyl transferase